MVLIQPSSRDVAKENKSCSQNKKQYFHMVLKFKSNKSSLTKKENQLLKGENHQ